MRKYTRLVLFWKRVKEAILSELEATTLAADNDVRAQPAAHQTRPYLLDTFTALSRFHTTVSTWGTTTTIPHSDTLT